MNRSFSQFKATREGRLISRGGLKPEEILCYQTDGPITGGGGGGVITAEVGGL